MFLSVLVLFRHFSFCLQPVCTCVRRRRWTAVLVLSCHPRYLFCSVLFALSVLLVMPLVLVLLYVYRNVYSPIRGQPHFQDDVM